MTLSLGSLFSAFADMFVPADNRAELTSDIAKKLAAAPTPHLVFARDLSPSEQITLSEYACFNGGIARHDLADGETIFCDVNVSRHYKAGVPHYDATAFGMYAYFPATVPLCDVLPRLDRAGPRPGGQTPH